MPTEHFPEDSKSMKWIYNALPTSLLRNTSFAVSGGNLMVLRLKRCATSLWKRIGSCHLLAFSKISLMGILLAVGTSGCRISYSFSGSSIDYNEIRTFSIEDFANRAALVYPPAAPQVTEQLRRLYKQQTRLEEVSSDGDFALEGAIVGYDLAPIAVQEDAFASMTRFTLTISVHFDNKANPKKSFTRNFSAYSDFDSSSLFSAVQDGLLKQLIEDITKQIFNATAEDW